MAERTLLWREAFEIFERLQALDDGTRAWELEQLAHSRPELHAYVARLAKAGGEAEAAQFLGGVAADAAGFERSSLTTREPDATIGPYRLVRALGSGGMGEVWLARRADGLFETPVALKLMHAHLTHPSLRDRFVREGRILGQLTHPNVARLLDAGVAPADALYLAIEYVDGLHLDRWCDEQRADIDARLRLFLRVCDAVAHSHAHLVVHRDLKPSNILVTPEGEVKLLDFGIAKLVESSGLGDQTELTRLGGRALTPEYSAPEQILGQPVTVATDVYSLGVLLYRLLTGRSPYGDEAQPVARIEQAVLDLEPALPSTRVDDGSSRTADLADRRNTKPPRLRRRLRGDLDHIVAQALRKSTAERYATVPALADDVRRHLELEPVRARGTSARQQVAKFVRRHRLRIVAAAAGTGLLVALATGVVWKQRAAEAEQTSRLERLVRQGRQELADQHPARAAVYLSEAYSQGYDTTGLRWWLARAMQPADALDARPIVHDKPFSGGVFDADGARLLTMTDGRGEIWDVASRKLLVTLQDVPGDVYPAPRFSPDGRRIAMTFTKGAPLDHTSGTSVWDAHDGRLLHSVRGFIWPDVNQVFAPDSRRLLTTTQPAEGSGEVFMDHVWDVESGKALRQLTTPGGTSTPGFSPDGSLIVTGGEGPGDVTVWSAADYKPRLTIHPNPGTPTSAYFGADGRLVFTMGENGVFKVWDSQTGSPVDALGSHAMYAPAISRSADGSRWLTMGGDGFKVWDARAGRQILASDAPSGYRFDGRLSPDGTQLLTVSGRFGPALWDLGQRELAHSLDAHAGAVGRAIFTPDGKQIVTLGQDGRANFWSVARLRRPVSLLQHDDALIPLEAPEVVFAAFDASGNRVLTGARDQRVRWWSADTGERLKDLEGHKASVMHGSPAPDGHDAATIDADGLVIIWSLDDGRERRRWQATDAPETAPMAPTFSLAYSADGTRLLTTAAGRARVWDVTTGQRLHEFGESASPVSGAAWLGDIVLTWGKSGAARLHRAGSGELVGTLDRTASGIEAVAVHAGTQSVAIAGEGGEVAVWRVRAAGTDQNSVVEQGATRLGPITALAFDVDAHRLALGDTTGLIVVRDLSSDVSLELPGHAESIRQLQFSSDGRLLISASDDRAARVWDAATGTSLGILGGHTDAVRGAVLNTNGDRALTFGRLERHAKLWDARLEHRPAEQVAQIVACKIPWKLEGNELVAATPAPERCAIAE